MKFDGQDPPAKPRRSVAVRTVSAEWPYRYSRRLRVVTLTTLAGLALSHLFLALAVPRFTARAELSFGEDRTKADTEKSAPGKDYSGSDLVAGPLSVIGSEPVLRRVVEALALSNDPEFVNPPATTGLLSRIKTLFAGNRAPVEPSIAALESLARCVEVRRSQQRNVFIVRATSAAPAKAAAIANAIADSYLATAEDGATAATGKRLIAPARTPSSPSTPLGWLVISLGGLGGLGLGLVLALAIGATNKRVRNLAEAANITGLTPVASIPSLHGSVLGGKSLRGYLPVKRTAAASSDLLDAVRAPNSAAQRRYCQALGQLADRIRAKMRKGPAATVLFVAPNADAGSSAIALAVAVSAVRDRQRVLLVDANAGSARLSAALAPEFASDTVVVLDNPEHLAGITTHVGGLGLSILPIARAGLGTLQEGQRRRLATGLSELAKRYDFVVIDAGALLDDEGACCLIPVADDVILIAGKGVTTHAALKEASRRLALRPGQTGGIVLNPITGGLASPASVRGTGLAGVTLAGGEPSAQSAPCSSSCQTND